MSAAATALTGAYAAQVVTALHQARAGYADLGVTGPTTIDEVSEVLHRLAFMVRWAPDVSDARRAGALLRLQEAIDTTQSGRELPDRATLSAWATLIADLSPRSSVAYHKRFPVISEHAVTATRRLITSRPSRLPLVAAQNALEQWVQETAAGYQMNPPAVIWDEIAVHNGGGMYDSEDHAMHLARPSVVTTLHEFRHAMQALEVGEEPTVGTTDIEDDARAWSLSLYFNTAPETFGRLVRAGRIFHIHADDL